MKLTKKPVKKREKPIPLPTALSAYDGEICVPKDRAGFRLRRREIWKFHLSRENNK